MIKPQQQEPKRDSVVGEDGKTVLRHEAQQDANREQCAEKRSHETEHKESKVRAAQVPPFLREVVAGGRKHHRNRQKKRELSRCLPI